VTAFLRRHAHRAVALLLVAWGIGLAVAALQLDAWRQDLTRTLLQLHVDAQFRARAQHRDAVDPAWYRRKALSLLAATERLRRDAAWTLFVPGSWQVFDDLEERVEAKVAQAFGDIVVETLRRELLLRASDLTGIPLQGGTGDLRPDGECRAPQPRSMDRRLTAAAEDLPEFVAVADYVAAVEQLDQAARSLAALQQSGGGHPQQLRELVRYTLGTELPGSLAEGVRLFHPLEEVNVQPALLQARLQWATSCTLAKAVAALHSRLLNTNELFALEQGLAERSAGLFDPRPRPAPLDRTVERLRAVHALLEDQHALLARGRNGWMRQGSLRLGPGYDQLLERIARTHLLGPQALRDLDNQSGAAFAEFRRQFEATFGQPGEAGIVWLEPEQRFGLSAQRTALREGLASLLQAPFMADQRSSPLAAASPLPAAVGHARQLAQTRQAFLEKALPRFPAAARPVVERTVNARVSELVYDASYRALKASLPGATQPLDPASFRAQRESAEEVQALLDGMRAGALARRLGSVLDQELLRRLAVVHDSWLQHPLNDARAVDFSAWQGEPLAAWQGIAAQDPASASAAVAALARRLVALGQQADGLLALGSERLAHEPAAQRWTRLKAELARYHAHQADSSLLALERYLAGLGGDLRRENCAERLARTVPPVHDDDVALRLAQWQNALSARCGALRFEQAPSAAAAGSASTASP
jgi:type VI secretion system protein ImpL